MQSKADDADSSPLRKKQRLLTDCHPVTAMDDCRSSDPHGASAKKRRKKRSTEKGGKKKSKEKKRNKKKEKQESPDSCAQLFVIDRTGAYRN